MKITRIIVTQEQLIKALSLPDDTIIFDIERQAEYSSFGFVIHNSISDNKPEGGQILNRIYELHKLKKGE